MYTYQCNRILHKCTLMLVFCQRNAPGPSFLWTHICSNSIRNNDTYSFIAYLFFNNRKTNFLLCGNLHRRLTSCWTVIITVPFSGSSTKCTTFYQVNESFLFVLYLPGGVDVHLVHHQGEMDRLNTFYMNGLMTDAMRHIAINTSVMS